MLVQGVPVPCAGTGCLHRAAGAGCCYRTPGVRYQDGVCSDGLQRFWTHSAATGSCTWCRMQFGFGCWCRCRPHTPDSRCRARDRALRARARAFVCVCVCFDVRKCQSCNCFRKSIAGAGGRVRSAAAPLRSAPAASPSPSGVEPGGSARAAAVGTGQRTALLDGADARPVSNPRPGPGDAGGWDGGGGGGETTTTRTRHPRALPGPPPAGCGRTPFASPSL